MKSCQRPRYCWFVRYIGIAVSIWFIALFWPEVRHGLPHYIPGALFLILYPAVPVLTTAMFWWSHLTKGFEH